MIAIDGQFAGASDSAINSYGYGKATLGASDGSNTGSARDPFAGDIAEVIVFPQRLTTLESGAVEAYLNEKYGLQGSSSSCASQDADLMSGGAALSSDTYSGHGAALGVDGAVGTHAWMLGGQSAAASMVHLGYDFGEVVTVEQLRLNQQYSNSCYFLTDVWVQYSDDGVAWSNVLHVSGLTMEGVAGDGNFTTISLTGGQAARYWRLLADSEAESCGNPDIWLVRELEFVGCR